MAASSCLFENNISDAPHFFSRSKNGKVWSEDIKRNNVRHLRSWFLLKSLYNWFHPEETQGNHLPQQWRTLKPCFCAALLLCTPCHLFYWSFHPGVWLTAKWINIAWIGDWWINLDPFIFKLQWWHSCRLCCLWSPLFEMLGNVPALSQSTDGSRCCAHIHINGTITIHHNQMILVLTCNLRSRLLFVLLRLISQLRTVYHPDWQQTSWNGFCIPMKRTWVKGCEDGQKLCVCAFMCWKDSRVEPFSSGLLSKCCLYHWIILKWLKCWKHF